MNYDKFHVITVVSNPVNFKSRYLNFKRFEESLLRKGVQLWVVELATGARHHQITHEQNVHHIRLWETALEGILWHKEQLINIGFEAAIRYCPDVRYLMYSDSDLLFECDMLEKTIQALQHYYVVQAWSHCHSLDSKGHTTNTFKSFMYCRFNPNETSTSPGYPPRIGSPGGAWAFRREMLNQMGCGMSGPIIDFGICGSGDVYFANAVVGDIEKSCNPRFHPNYTKWLRKYAENTDEVLKRNVGYVSNTIRHLFHGRHDTRGYEWRDNVLINNQFDPETDLNKTAAGVWRLIVKTPRQMKLRDDLRKYAHYREEDATL